MTTIAPAPTTSDWPGSPISTLHSLARQAQSIPVEQYPDGASYVVRFEVPGIDPGRDLTVTVETGMLLVRAERQFDGPEGCQSEFRYGPLARHVALPPGSNARDVSAACHNGILTVRIGLEPEHEHASRTIPVQVEP
ncbi:MAG: Hsp20/alpha crystallin family protein [Streptosporangiaceae bacterium]|jgi:HSP20 family protein